MVRRVRGTATVALLAGTFSCTSLMSRPGNAPTPLSNEERVSHVLSRLTFGPRPGDVDRVARMGVDRWIDQQLHPASISDSAAVAALAPLPEWTTPTSQLASFASKVPLLTYARTPMAELMKDTVARAAMKLFAVGFAASRNFDAFYTGKVIRAETSDRQLLEVVSDFWENHFSVYAQKMPSREALILMDRDAIRGHALGKFRDLLGAVAHSPAMLYYLDNYVSKSGQLNENYARELLELHTLGVEGGYTQHDVIEVARAFTGWTIAMNANPIAFTFRADQHDTEVKTFLGHTLRAGRGVEDGEEVLDILARHPSTARHIAYELSRRLVSDDPPPSLVERAAATFMKTDGDIAQTVKTIVTSREFYSRKAFRAKVKSPFELVVSMRRSLGAPVDTTTRTVQWIARLGQPTFGFAAPNGWPEISAEWMNAGTIYQRLRFAGDVTDGRVAAMNVNQWPEWNTLSVAALQRQIDGVLKGLLGGIADPRTRDAMLAIDTTLASPDRLRAAMMIAFASPEFQRR